MPDLEILTSAQAADRLGIDRATLHRWANAGIIAVHYQAPHKHGTRLFTAREVNRVKADMDKQSA